MRALRLLLLFAAAVLTLAVAGCGSDDDSGSPSTGTGAASAAAAGAFPVTIENELGSVEVTEPPQRVVALDHPSADAAIALGVTPVAMARVDYAEGFVQPWTTTALGGEQPELFAASDGYPVEKIATYRPDLILATNAYGLAEVYDELSQLAPVVAWRSREGEESWQDATRQVGAALGKPDEADRLVADTEAAVAQARRANPAFEGKEVAFFNVVERTAWAINDPDDFSIRFLSDLGFALSPAIARLKSSQGRAQISQERYDLLDADVTIGTSPSPDELTALAESRIFSGLDAVRRGAFVELPLSPATSMAFPSALSVEYALDELVPLLARATG